MTKLTRQELISACNATFGNISNFLVRECGFQLPTNAKSGHETRLVCPHHKSKKNDEGGNCSANDNMALFRCYSCESTGNRASGSYVDACEIYLHMSTAEAISWLKQKCGIEENTGNYVKSVASIRQRYVEISHEILLKASSKNKEAVKALEYLHSRGFSNQTIKAYRIGVGASSPKGAAILQLLKEGYSEDDLLRAWILAKSRSGNLYSPWQNRVIQMAGEKIYGRSIRSKEEEKIPHLYSKGGKNVIFGSNSIKDDLDCIFVVESIYDALTINQYINASSMHWGCVATLGTKGVKEEELASFLNSKKPKEVIIIPDCDPWFREGHRHAAGQSAGIKKAVAFENAGLNVRIMSLPEGVDPNDLGKKNMPLQGFMKLVNRSLPTLLYRIGCTSKYYDLHTGGGVTGFMSAVKAILKSGVNIPTIAIEFVVSLTRLPKSEVEDALNGSIRVGLAKCAVKLLLAEGLSAQEIVNRLS